MDDTHTIIEQNHIIIDLLEVIDLCKEELEKKNEIIKRLEKSVQNAEEGREYWVKKYYNLQDDIIKKEQDESSCVRQTRQ